MTLGGASSLATKEALLCDCLAFGLERQQAREILDAIESGVLDLWKECLQEQGLSEQAIDRLAPCFARLAVDDKEIAERIDARRGGARRQQAAVSAPVRRPGGDDGPSL